MSTPVAAATETEILALSRQKYRWKTTGQFDLVADLFDDELVFVHLNGHISSKQEWLAELRSKRFIYNEITIKQAAVKVHGTTAVLVGSALFKVTMNGAKGTYNLVYTQKNGAWKLVNIHTCSG